MNGNQIFIANICSSINKNHAGTKATNDIIKILESKVDFFEIDTKKKKTTRIFFFLKSFILQKNKISSKKMCIMQEFVFENKLFLYLSEKYKYKKIFIIHDINSLRTQNQLEIKKEITDLNSFDFLISHNNQMTRWLKENGIMTTIIELELFDYLADTSSLAIREKNNFQIAFPGNLSKEKSGFIYKLTNMNLSKIHINLYGPNFSGESFETIQYKGVVHPDELIQTFTESFGLVWDGPEINDCTGDFGEYQRYNNPHKVSLYIAAGLPIIISNKAALADFVQKHKIGITIDSLEELEVIIPSICDEKYRIYTENLKELQKKVTTGYFITTALNKIEDIIDNESN
ncbi:MAG: sugar transferase [Culicoidibacterales bacterium]